MDDTKNILINGPLLIHSGVGQGMNLNACPACRQREHTLFMVPRVFEIHDYVNNGGYGESKIRSCMNLRR